LHVLDPDVDELWRRLADRNSQAGQATIDRATLASYLPYWQRPDAAELARYNPPDDI
jgi:hypothetical protein